MISEKFLVDQIGFALMEEDPGRSELEVTDPAGPLPGQCLSLKNLPQPPVGLPGCSRLQKNLNNSISGRGFCKCAESRTFAPLLFGTGVAVLLPGLQRKYNFADLLRALLFVGLGGCIGSMLRYLGVYWVQRLLQLAFPFGTLLVNLTGCFALGFFYIWAEKQGLLTEWRLFVATGILGGFTTFSAFSLESVTLLSEGHLLYLGLYVAGSVLLGIGAAAAGLALGKLV